MGQKLTIITACIVKCFVSPKFILQFYYGEKKKKKKSKTKFLVFFFHDLNMI